MSLRARLTLLYTTLLGGILLVFGAMIYVFVRLVLIAQVDEALTQTFNKILANTQVVSRHGMEVLQLPPLDLTENVYAQAWDTHSQLDSTNLVGFNQPFDPSGMQSSVPVFQDVSRGFHLRVLSVPLLVSGRRIGTLQLASNLALVDSTLRTLVTVLLVGFVIAIALTALIGWLSTKRALAPLEAVTQTALQITRADDLSRRISYQGPADDEVGQLITAFNQTLARLENLFHTQRRFVADVGHELRTPLTVIKGNVDLMRHMGCSDDESLAGIETEVDRLTRLVGDLLLLAQAESGKLPLDRRLVELDSIVLECLQQMQVLARDKLQLRLGEFDQVQVCGDQDRLKQVLVNLIGNAIKYTPAGGEVLVGLSKEGKQAKLIVHDTGPGIPKEDLPHVFERFYRGEKSRTRSREGKGFGLGLSIAYWIVRNHAGRIEVDSSKDQGTTFTVWLPLAEGDCQD